MVSVASSQQRSPVPGPGGRRQGPGRRCCVRGRCHPASQATPPTALVQPWLPPGWGRCPSRPKAPFPIAVTTFAGPSWPPFPGQAWLDDRAGVGLGFAVGPLRRRPAILRSSALATGASTPVRSAEGDQPTVDQVWMAWIAERPAATIAPAANFQKAAKLVRSICTIISKPLKDVGISERRPGSPKLVM